MIKKCFYCGQEKEIFHDDFCRECYYKTDYPMLKEKSKYERLQKLGRSYRQLQDFLICLEERPLSAKYKIQKIKRELKKRKNYLKKFHPVFWDPLLNPGKQIYISQKNEEKNEPTQRKGGI